MVGTCVAAPLSIIRLAQLLSSVSWRKALVICSKCHMYCKLYKGCQGMLYINCPACGNIYIYTIYICIRFCRGDPLRDGLKGNQKEHNWFLFCRARYLGYLMSSNGLAFAFGPGAWRFSSTHTPQSKQPAAVGRELF